MTNDERRRTNDVGLLSFVVRHRELEMLDTIRRDIQSVFERDPAARSVLEVALLYPGLHALWAHRVAHWLWQHNLKLLGALGVATGARHYRHRNSSGRENWQGVFH
jgi:hypothetical protein